MFVSIAISKRLILPALVSTGLLVAPALFAQGESGEALYKARCAGCHAADGSGSTSVGKSLKLRDLRSAEVQQMTDAQLTDIITKGKGKMPQYGNSLGAEKIKTVIGYLRQLAKAK